MIECVGGPLDGLRVSALRGDIWRPMKEGWTGAYVLTGDVYRWRAD